MVRPKKTFKANEEAQRRCAKRKMNSLGNIIGQSGIVNSKENMEKMRQQLQLSSAKAEISRLDEAEKAKKKKDKDKSLGETAARKLEENARDVLRLTKDEIEALLLKAFNVTMPGSNKLRKTDYAKVLLNELRCNIGKYEEYMSSQGLTAV